MYKGSVYNFTGTLSGYIEGYVQGNLIEGDFKNFHLDGFTGYVDVTSSHDYKTGRGLDPGVGATVDPQGNGGGQRRVEEDDDDAFDDYEEDDDDAFDDYEGGDYQLPEQSIRFGDDNITVNLQVQASREDLTALSSSVGAALQAAGFAGRTYPWYTAADASYSQDGVALSDPRAAAALTALIEGLGQPNISVVSAEVTSTRTGEPVVAEWVTQLENL